MIWIRLLAEEKHATPAQISLAWMSAKKPYIVPIPGTRKVKRLEENMKASEIVLTTEEVRKIDEMLDEMPMSAVFGGSKIKSRRLRMKTKKKEDLLELESSYFCLC